MNKSIAIVDDEQDIVELITYHLKKENFKVNEFYDGESLLSYIENYIPDLIILDLMLPEIDGLEICRILKKENRTSLIPIIMLTAKGTEIDKVVGLELGADDYIVKPFSPRELVARVKAVLRRGSCKEETSLIQIGKILEIDLQKFEVNVENIKIDLTSTEFKVLKLLTKNIGWVYSRNQILDYLWGNEKIVLDRTIDVHIKNLREKLGKAGKFISS